MHPIEHPETIMLIHETMVRHEMRRHADLVLDEPGRPRPPGGPGRGLRATVGRALVAIGARLDPGSRPVDQRRPLGNAG